MTLSQIINFIIISRVALEKTVKTRLIEELIDSVSISLADPCFIVRPIFKRFHSLHTCS